MAPKTDIMSLTLDFPVELYYNLMGLLEWWKKDKGIDMTPELFLKFNVIFWMHIEAETNENPDKLFIDALKDFKEILKQ